MKRSLILLSFILAAGTLMAQDMPPLPDLPNQGGGNSAMPQAVPAPSAAAAPSDANAVPALPALPSSSTPAASAPADNSSPALPALPNQSGAQAPAAPANNASPALPALPDQSGAQAPAAPANNASPALPALPADNSNQPAAQPAPAAEATPAEQAPAEAQPAKKHGAKAAPWKVSKARPNSIFDGVVVAKGGNETSRIAWTAQEVLNAFEFHGYHVVHEKGNYPGQGKGQYRTLTFKVPKSKQTVNVYLKPMGKKVWVRVRPSNPPLPAAYTKAQVAKMRQADRVAFALLKKKFGHRISPYYHWSSFEPQNHSQSAADETEQVED